MEELGIMLALIVYAFGLPWALRRPHPEDDDDDDIGQSLSDRQWRESRFKLSAKGRHNDQAS